MGVFNKEMKIASSSPSMKAVLNYTENIYSIKKEREKQAKSASCYLKNPSLFLLKSLWELLVCFLISQQFLILVLSVFLTAAKACHWTLSPNAAGVDVKWPQNC